MRWFVPDGVKAPSHLPPGRMSVMAGVDGLSGHCVNGIYQDGDWQKTQEGWYFWDNRGDAADCLRLRAPAGTEVMVANRPWLIPALLRPLAGGWVSALPRLFDGSKYVDPPEYADVQCRLRAHLHDAAGGIVDEIAVAILASDIMQIAYHLSMVELVALGWWREDLITKFICSTIVTDEADG